VASASPRLQFQFEQAGAKSWVPGAGRISSHADCQAGRVPVVLGFVVGATVAMLAMPLWSFTFSSGSAARTSDGGWSRQQDDNHW
jgi:hypothetical protein